MLTVNAFMLTVFPLCTLKIRKFGVPPAVLRVTVTKLVPPSIVRFLLIRSSALVSVTVLTPAWKVIVLPTQASAMICRNEPAPASLPLVTTVLGQSGAAFRLTAIWIIASAFEVQPKVTFGAAPGFVDSA